MASVKQRSKSAKALTQSKMDNPLLKPWRGSFGMPPFEEIQPAHFLPAFKIALKKHREDILSIAKNESRPTFSNTIKALEKCGSELQRICRVFYNLSGSHTNRELQEIEREISPKLAVHQSAIFMNSALFKRVEELYLKRNKLKLDDEQLRVLELYYTWFIRAGAQLKAKDKKRVAAIQERLATLTAAFMQNVLADEQSWYLELSSERDLAGLSESMRSAARQAAMDLGLKKKNAHAITLARASVEGFLTQSTRRDLREKAFKAWASRGEKSGKTDNRQIVAEVVALRAELADILGFECYGDYALQDTMAKTMENARGLLDSVWPAAVARAQEEHKALCERARSEGQNYKVEAWDWRHFSEKERKARFDLDEAELRPYLQLENIIQAAFDTANKLFGLKFTEVENVPVYHPDVRVFEVTDKKGEHVAIFMGDYFARPSKRSGAWMSNFRSQHKIGRDVRPIIVNVMNFSKGAEDSPALLTFDDARTLFHEFGHALHGMLSDVTYPAISGTSVSRDFVELPSQLFEHWMMQPDILKRYAVHAETGKSLPVKLLKRLKAARNFNQGFATVEYTACAIVDLELHKRSTFQGFDTSKFESQALSDIGMPSAIIMRHRLPHFMHIMGGYEAGYYSYLWSEVMDADAFSAFEEAGDIYDKKIARRLKKYIYSAGNRRDPHEAYKAFRGRPPEIDALLKKRGFKH